VREARTLGVKPVRNQRQQLLRALGASRAFDEHRFHAGSLCDPSLELVQRGGLAGAALADE
jgi:hypothetical protein